MAFESHSGGLVDLSWTSVEGALHGKRDGESHEAYLARRKAEMSRDCDVRTVENEAAVEQARAQALGHYPVHESVAS